ncbi:aldo/keto reductase [Leptolyngbya sp. NK1-12]|uniref:Aldo/keto reductase n=1 Tax=Leptolyngbya sp. NK1-12 TaxID=2547451 RepID=A0AA97AKB2_9CYAN|nr:aldo/keto reductase [Leptolyngbya sp. NK1-12]MBF2051816.1 aldo/keto reductase [Elainella sp. C42_A2020_010]RNJ67213.1 MAG: aldo/keto reductase [Leptolyngbya sp. IPPAS B-1204]WNZ27629.1 aldo/keto reductase [Leptolyngbya sp. NK1-12]
MLYRPFGNAGFNVSTIGMGTWNIGNQWGEIDQETALATVRSAVEHGINLFDTAESYGIPTGLSEERLGKALMGLRDRVHLVSKIGRWGRRTGQMVPMTTVDMVRLCVHASLYRLRTDYIDVMLCHDGKIEDPSVYLEGFERLKEQGLIRAYGISTDKLKVLKRFNVHNTCSVVEVEYSLLNRKAEAEFFPYCQEHGIAVLVRGPLYKGLLSGKYSPDTVFTDTVRSEWYSDENRSRKLAEQLAIVERLKNLLPPGEDMVTAALRFVTSHPVQPVAIPGAKSPEQAAMNARAGDKLLTPRERELLLEAITPITAGEPAAMAG